MSEPFGSWRDVGIRCGIRFDSQYSIYETNVKLDSVSRSRVDISLR